jgi:hypothetical protein
MEDKTIRLATKFAQDIQENGTHDDKHNFQYLHVSGRSPNQRRGDIWISEKCNKQQRAQT